MPLFLHLFYSSEAGLIACGADKSVAIARKGGHKALKILSALPWQGPSEPGQVQQISGKGRHYFR